MKDLELISHLNKQWQKGITDEEVLRAIAGPCLGGVDFVGCPLMS